VKGVEIEGAFDGEPDGFVHGPSKNGSAL
jgi:hypothetical protein